MSDTVDQIVAEEAIEAAKIDAVLAALAAGRSQVADLIAQIAVLQQQLATLPLSASDKAKLDAVASDMANKVSQIDAALTPPSTP